MSKIFHELIGLAIVPNLPFTLNVGRDRISIIIRFGVKLKWISIIIRFGVIFSSHLMLASVKY